MPYAKNKIVVKTPKRSGFDKSHRNTGSFLCGTLTPILCDELIPNSRVNLRINLAAQLPPLVSDTYMNCKLKVESFFVPSRLLCSSFEDFFCDFPRRVYTNASNSSGQVNGAFSDVTAAVPVFQIYTDTPFDFYRPGSLLDYLGFKVDAQESSGEASLLYGINPLPLIAYHLVWQEWYRNPRVQNPAFCPSLGLGPNYANPDTRLGAAYLPSTYFHRQFVGDNGTVSADNTLMPVHASNRAAYNCADGVSLFSLRQRNFGLDYFTGARVDAQQGSPSAVTFNVDQDGEGSISIAALRAANSLQQFRERNNIPSPRLVDQVRARYNASLADGVAQRPICIGSASYNLDSSGINQTAPASGSSDRNPFSGVAAQYGRGYASGSDFVIDDFTANEPGYLMVLMSMVPEVTYSTGIDPMFRRYRAEGSITDMACSLLQNVGDQPIDVDEISGVSTRYPVVFGYQDRYADFMYKPNQVHGEMRDGSTLESFVLQRAFDTTTTLTSSFLEIPVTYLDGIMVADTQTIGLSGWFDAYLNYKVSMPLAEFSIPSLQDPAYEHGESVVLRRNGQIF